MKESDSLLLGPQNTQKRGITLSLDISSVSSSFTMYDPNYNNGSANPFSTYVSRPDLNPPVFNVNGSFTPGYLFIAQRGSAPKQTGLIIADTAGDIIWVNPYYGQGNLGFRKQQYQGKDVLTTWNGVTEAAGYGEGRYFVIDQGYNLIANFTSLNNTSGDMHEFKIVNDTALVTIYEQFQYDLTAYGGTADGYINSGRFQHINMTSNELIFDWRSIDHVDPSESYASISGAGIQANPWDYFHINSVDYQTSDNSYLISSRHCSTIYKITSDGNIAWRLGGKMSNFTMGTGTNFEWQHHARWRGSNQISLFDNAAQSTTVVNETETRGLLLNVDQTNFNCTLATQFINPSHPLSTSQGDVQFLDNGNVFMGYGDLALAAEYAPSGQVLGTLQFAPITSDVQSYRVYNQNWTATPGIPPDVAVQNNNLYFSWNGATGLSYWNVYGGNDPSSLALVSSLNKTGFETSAPFNMSFAQIGAVASNGSVISLSNVLANNGSVVSNSSNIAVSTPTTSSSSPSSTSLSASSSSSSSSSSATPLAILPNALLLLLLLYHLCTRTL